MCCFINYSNQISHHFGDTQLRKCLLCPNTPQMRKSWWVSLVIGWMDDNYKWNCFFYYISLLIVKYINSIGKFKFEYFVTWVEEAWKLYNFSLENWAKTAREEYLWFGSMLRLKRNLTHRHSGEIGSELFSF